MGKKIYLYDDKALYNKDVLYGEQRFLTFDGCVVKARNYVGFIGYEGDTINIYLRYLQRLLWKRI